MLTGPRLFKGVCERMKEGLRDEYPDLDEEGIHRLLVRRIARLRKLDAMKTPIA